VPPQIANSSGYYVPVAMPRGAEHHNASARRELSKASRQEWVGVGRRSQSSIVELRSKLRDRLRRYHVRGRASHAMLLQRAHQSTGYVLYLFFDA